MTVTASPTRKRPRQALRSVSHGHGRAGSCRRVIAAAGSRVPTAALRSESDRWRPDQPAAGPERSDSEVENVSRRIRAGTQAAAAGPAAPAQAAATGHEPGRRVTAR